MTTTITAERRTMRIPILLVLLSVVPAVAGTARLFRLATGAVTVDNARFFTAPVPVVLHILAVVPFSIVGALQFSPRLRQRRWHRNAGIAMVPLGLVGALTGLWMAHFYPWPTGDGEAVYVMRLIVGFAMAGSIISSLVVLGRRDYAGHGAWMTRAYALGMGAGTQVLTHLPWFVLVGTPGETSRAILMGLGWAINSGVAEYVIRRPFARRAHAPLGPCLSGYTHVYTADC